MIMMNQNRQNEAILEHMFTQHKIVTVSLNELSFSVKILNGILDCKKYIVQYTKHSRSCTINRTLIEIHMILLIKLN